MRMRSASSTPHRVALLAILAFPISAAQTRGDTIYATTDPGGFLGYWGPDVFINQSVGVRFTPTGDYTFDSAGLWFMNNDFEGNTHALVRVTLRTDDDSTPGVSIPSTVIIEEMFLTVTTIGWDPVMEVVNSALHPRLCTGQNYWIVAESNVQPFVNGVWVMAGESTGFAANTDQGQTNWQPGGMGAVPATRVFGTPVIQGDVDGNGTADGRDVSRFVQAVLGVPQSPTDVARADMNCDRVANALDIAGFVAAMLD